MHIERLETLADTISRGVIEFPDLKLVTAFTMEVSFTTDNMSSWLLVRDDIPDPSLPNSCGCLMGFSILLFSPLKWIIHETPMDFSITHEATKLLELDLYQANKLFYGCMDRYTTGPDAARVVRKLILTEEVDWSILRY